MNRHQPRFGLSVTAVAIVALATGCSYPNQFRNVRTDEAHAVLVGKHVTAFHINQQPTSFWRSREKFRIPPGPTTVRPSTGFWDFPDYPLLEFTAIVGHRYTLTHQKSNDCHWVLAWERPEDRADARVIAQVEARSYEALANDAIRCFAELRAAGKIPGLGRDEHGRLETDVIPHRVRVVYPISVMLHVRKEVDQSRYSYTLTKAMPSAAWRLTKALRAFQDGQREELALQ